MALSSVSVPRPLDASPTEAGNWQCFLGSGFPPPLHRSIWQCCLFLLLGVSSIWQCCLSLLLVFMCGRRRRWWLCGRRRRCCLSLRSWQCCLSLRCWLCGRRRRCWQCRRRGGRQLRRYHEVPILPQLPMGKRTFAPHAVPRVVDRPRHMSLARHVAVTALLVAEQTLDIAIPGLIRNEDLRVEVFCRQRVQPQLR